MFKINDHSYEWTSEDTLEQITIYDYCISNNISIPYHNDSQEIYYVIVNDLLSNAKEVTISNYQEIYTCSKELYLMLEHHENLKDILSNRHIHKLAIIDEKMSPKKAQILSKGFNEVITKDFLKKFKIIEESALIIKEITRSLDNLTFKKPIVILEEDSLINLVPNHLIKNIINVGSYNHIINAIFKASLDASLIEYVFITEDVYNNKTNKEVTFSYLEKIEDIESSNIDNVKKLLKVEENKVNYNSLINYLIDILKTKQVLDKDIYQSGEFLLKPKGKTIKIVNLLKGDITDADIVLVLKDEECEITKSILHDKDVNYIYQNYLKEPGRI